MKTNHLAIVTTLLGAALAYGCDDESTTAGTGGAGGSGGTTTSTTSWPTSTSTSSTGTGGTGPQDESTSCADALPLEEKENTLGGYFWDYEGVIAEPGDVDYFTFQATAGDWVRYRVYAEESSDLNPVLTVLDSDGAEQVALNNNLIGSSSLDSEIAIHVLDTGTYCLKVEDYSTYSGNTPEGDPTFGYRAVALPLDFDLYDTYNVDTEPNDSTGSAQTGVSFDVASDLQISTNFAGMLAPGDVDVYEWTAPTGALGLYLYFTPPGNDGFGSTQDPGIVRFYENDGTTVLAELDVQAGSDRFSSVPITAGNAYFLEVNFPQSASAGANDFYYLKFRTTDTLNDQETDDTANDDASGADTAVGSVDGDATRHYVGGTLTAPDTDWWAFQASAGNSIVLRCSSWRAGSGVRDATFAVFDNPQGSHLQTETEVEAADVYWSDSSSSASMGAVAVTTTGTHFLRISATNQDANVTSNHYLCGIHVYQ